MARELVHLLIFYVIMSYSNIIYIYFSALSTVS
jgi:hypothetical protein